MHGNFLFISHLGGEGGEKELVLGLKVMGWGGIPVQYEPEKSNCISKITILHQKYTKYGTKKSKFPSKIHHNMDQKSKILPQKYPIILTKKTSKTSQTMTFEKWSAR